MLTCCVAVRCHWAAKTAAVYEYFDLPGFQSIAPICCTLPLLSSDSFPISCVTLSALRGNQNEIWLDFTAQPCVKRAHLKSVAVIIGTVISNVSAAASVSISSQWEAVEHAYSLHLL